MDRKTFLLVMLVPAITILAFIGYNYSVSFFGEDILLKTGPIDPSDIFRGDYVQLSYEISSINQQQIPHDYDFNPGEYAYAALSRGEKYWFVTRLEHQKPMLRNNEVCIRGTVAGSFNNRLRITWGIESFFVPEGRGWDIQREIRDVSAKVAVDSTCRAVLKELYINDVPVEFKNE